MKLLSVSQIHKLDDRELMKYCQQVGNNSRKWKNWFIALLPEVARRGVYRKRFESIYEYAAKVGGVGKKSVQDVLRLDIQLEDKPALKKLIPKIGINKVRVVTSIATVENQNELAEKVKTMSKQALEIFTRETKEVDPGISPEKEYIGLQLDKTTAFELRKFKKKLENSRREKISFNEVIKELLTSVEGSKPPKKRVKRTSVTQNTQTSRYIPAEKRRELSDKCAKCNKPAEVIHHPDRFALTKNHEILQPLCKTHHELEHQTNSQIDRKFRQYKFAFG